MDFGVAGWPKAELHVHLEGSLRPATLRLIEPSLTDAAIADHCRFDSFPGFLHSYKWVTGHLRKPRHYYLAMRALLDEFSGQNIRYAEVNLSLGVMLWRNHDADANFAAIQEAAAGHAVRVAYVADAVRHLGLEHVQKTAEWAVRLKRKGVVAFGIGGDEAAGPAAAFREVFAWIRAQGLAAVPHAGETAGPASVWAALELGAARIGHGFRAIEDPALVRHLADRGIPLEICLSSNLATGAVGRWEDHPLRALFDAGVPLTLNSDDPALFSTTLSREYDLAAEHYAFTREELLAISRNAFRYALTPGLKVP